MCFDGVFANLASIWKKWKQTRKRPDSVILDTDEFSKGRDKFDFIVLPIVQDQILESMKNMMA